MKQIPQTLSAEQICGMVGASPVLLEIGCHEGTDTKKFLERMPGARIYCWDCEQRALTRFKVRIEQNPRVVLYEEAVADIDGKRAFFASTGKAGRRDDWDFSGSLCRPTGHLTRSPEIHFKQPTLVRCVRLDTWFEEHPNIHIIDFIWADVQGSQQLVIQGAIETFKYTRYLYIESHDPVAYADEPTQEELIEGLSPWFEPVAIYAKENILFKSRELP